MGKGNQSPLVGNPQSHCSSLAQTQPVAETRRSSAGCSRGWKFVRGETGFRQSHFPLGLFHRHSGGTTDWLSGGSLGRPEVTIQGARTYKPWQFRVERISSLCPRFKRADKKISLPFSSAKADFSQNKWNVQAAIDGKDETGWAISPQTGKNHKATFLLKNPLPAKETSHLRIEMAQLYGPDTSSDDSESWG